MPDDQRLLHVLLHDQEVGTLRYQSEKVAFRFTEQYREASDRRVLGQIFEDDLDKEHRVSSGIPAWFSNLLAEGPLREMIAKRFGLHPRRSFFLIGHLGDDLPGDVRVRPESDETLRTPPKDENDDGLQIATRVDDSNLAFSLAGIQLKFSVMREDRGITIPVIGPNGEFIVKLPDLRYEGIPENEFSMMTWAGMAGIAVPQFELVRTADIANLPSEVTASPGYSYLVHRFDRVAGTRVHIEDFAQILNRFPTHDGKYGGANYESIARILLSLGGKADVHELVRRLVAIIAMGNGDAHLKNWSLIYPDGRSGVLSPAYDLVSTAGYLKGEETLALNLAGTKKFASINIESFRRMSRKVGLDDERELDDVVRETVSRLQDSWRQIRASMPMLDDRKTLIDERLRTLPLLQE